MNLTNHKSHTQKNEKTITRRDLWLHVEWCFNTIMWPGLFPLQLLDFVSMNTASRQYDEAKTQGGWHRIAWAFLKVRSLVNFTIVIRYYCVGLSLNPQQLWPVKYHLALHFIPSKEHMWSDPVTSHQWSHCHSCQVYAGVLWLYAWEGPAAACRWFRFPLKALSYNAGYLCTCHIFLCMA